MCITEQDDPMRETPKALTTQVVKMSMMEQWTIRRVYQNDKSSTTERSSGEILKVQSTLQGKL